MAFGQSDVSINSFTVNNAVSTSVEIGSTASVQWNTSDADNCSASSTGPATLANWDSNTVINVSGQVDVTFTEAGIYNLQLDCEGTNGSLDDAVVSANVGSASISSFTISPNVADKGSNVNLTFSWASTNTSGGCYGSWPNSDDLPSTGTDTLSISNIQSGVNFTLICANLHDEVTATAALTVNEPAPTCDVGLTSKRERSWTSIFGSVWPGPDARQTRVDVPDTGYYSVRFDTGSTVDTGAVTTFEASGTAGGRITAISEISGCFDVDSTCKTGGRVSAMQWNTTDSGSGCKLKANTTYYWNITFTNGYTPGTSSCLGTFCETYLRVINSD